MLACKEEECEAALKAERERVLTPPGSSPRRKKFLRFRHARVWGHTAWHAKQKLPGSDREMLLAGLKKGVGKCSQSALLVFSLV